MKSTHFGFRHLASVLCFGAYALQATTFTVTTTNISGPGSLPVVINQANASPGLNIVQFGVTNALTLASPLAPITNDITIIGRTDVPTVISGGGTLPIFSFAAGTTNILSRLVLRNGNTTGGGAAIKNAGTLSVSSCVMSNNSAPGGNGGAVSNAGTMTIVSSTIAGNQAGNGGGVYNVGTLTIGRLTVSSNQATLGFGGGIYNSGGLSASETTLLLNRAVGQSGESNGRSSGGGGAGLGGGLYTSMGGVSITNCTFYGNLANGGSGFGRVVASGKGGGNNGGAGATSASNAAPGGYGGGGGGGITSAGHGAGANGGFGGGGGGGGIYQAYAGVGGFGGGNGSGANLPYGGGGGGGAGLGAGIFVESGTIAMVNCTITTNSAVRGEGGWWADGQYSSPGQGIGAGIFNHSGNVQILNTIIAGSAAESSSPDVYGAFNSSGFNLIGNKQGSTGLSSNDFQNVAANLGILQDNGGPTLTCALLQGSLAIGAGSSAGAPPIDQRGVARPPDKCDIGAFQTGTIPSPPRTATASAVLAYDFVVSANVTDGGYGYTNTPIVRIVGGGGSGAQAVAVMSNGVVIAVNVLDAGYGYTGTPLIVIDPPFIPNPVLGIATLSCLSFSDLALGGVYQLQQSVGWYWSNQPVTFTATNALYTQMVAGMAGSGDYRMALNPVPAQAFATAIVDYGFVVHATVTSGGSGYVTPPAVTIVGGGGSNATAVANISGGVVTSITISDAGIGYTDTPTVQIDPPPAAAISPMVSPVMRVDCTSLAPYVNYQIQFKSALGGAWANWNAGLFSPTGVTNSQYLFITNAVGFFRVTYAP